MTGDDIKHARKQLGLTQAEFARMVGYSGKTYVANIEAGRYAVSLPVQRLVAIYLDGYRPDDWPDGK
jgi:DNA-binding XRE family transcriptional regulator